MISGKIRVIMEFIPGNGCEYAITAPCEYAGKFCLWRNLIMSDKKNDTFIY